jgi:hypothetical protein
MLETGRRLYQLHIDLDIVEANMHDLENHLKGASHDICLEMDDRWGQMSAPSSPSENTFVFRCHVQDDMKRLELHMDSMCREIFHTSDLFAECKLKLTSLDEGTDGVVCGLGAWD